jgi:hypothetical protein
MDCDGPRGLRRERRRRATVIGGAKRTLRAIMIRRENVDAGRMRDRGALNDDKAPKRERGAPAAQHSYCPVALVSHHMSGFNRATLYQKRAPSQ